LVRWFVGSFVRWFVGSLVRWFVGSFVRRFVGSLVGWLVRSFDFVSIDIVCLIRTQRCGCCVRVSIGVLVVGRWSLGLLCRVEVVPCVGVGVGVGVDVKVGAVWLLFGCCRLRWYWCRCRCCCSVVLSPLRCCCCLVWVLLFGVVGVGYCSVVVWCVVVAVDSCCSVAMFCRQSCGMICHTLLQHIQVAVRERRRGATKTIGKPNLFRV